MAEVAICKRFQKHRGFALEVKALKTLKLEAAAEMEAAG